MPQPGLEVVPAGDELIVNTKSSGALPGICRDKVAASMGEIVIVRRDFAVLGWAK